MKKTRNHPARNVRSRARRARNGAFTIVELMVVLVIALMLMSIILPSFMAMRLLMKYSASEAVLQTLDGAIEAYMTDFEEYPHSDADAFASGLSYSDWYGMELLPLFLTGYGADPGDGGADGIPGTDHDILIDDGNEGYGYRLEQRGLVHGPYGGAQNMRVRESFSGSDARIFIDAFGNPIYYYRCYEDPNGDTYYREDNADLSAGEGDFDYEFVGGQRLSEDAHTDFATYVTESTVVEDPDDSSSRQCYDDDASDRLYRRDFLLISAGADGCLTRPRGSYSPPGEFTPHPVPYFANQGWGFETSYQTTSDDVRNFGPREPVANIVKHENQVQH